jgi:hypothetical protein
MAARTSILNTSHGCLIRNPKNPLFLDMIIFRNGHDLHPILDELHDALAELVQDYQIILNYGNFRQYYKTIIQVKLKNVADLERFMEPRPFDPLAVEFEVIVNDHE